MMTEMDHRSEKSKEILPEEENDSYWSMQGLVHLILERY
jgi:hypothetical protein